MNLVAIIAVSTALLGSALIGGIFFAFSNFVMKALANVPSHEGIAVMQSINVTVLNPSFLVAFMGTALMSILVTALAVASWETASAPWFVAGTSLYLVGTFLITILGNVPLNNQLAAVQADDPAAITTWDHYLVRWKALNTVRAVTALCAALMLTVGLIQQGS